MSKSATLRLPFAVRSRNRRAAPCALLGALVCAAPPAHGEVIRREVRVEYAAPEGCPDQAAFFERVVERARAGALSSREDAAWAVRIEVTGAGPSRGRLVVRDPSGSATERRFEGASCNEVVSALAFGTALAFEAQNVSPPPVPVGDIKRQEPAAAAQSPVSPERRTVAPAPASTAFALGASANAAGGAAPAVIFGAGIFGEIAWNRAASARLGVAYDAGPASAVAGGSAQFSRILGQIEGCSWLLRSGDVALAPCLQLDIGAVVGRASDIPNARNIVRPWVAVTPMLVARWAPRPIFVEIHAGAPFPLVRDRFFFEPGSTIYQVPAVGETAGLAVGVPLR